MISKEVNEENIKKFIHAFSATYTVDEILTKFDLFKNVTEKNDSYEMSCPFHEDKRPSFRIKKDNGVWNCFSCGKGGTLFRLYYLLSNTNLPFSYFVEKTLIADKLLQENAKISTVFLVKEKEKNFSELMSNRQRQIRSLRSKNTDITISYLSDYIREQRNDFDTLAKYLTMVQANIDLSDIKSFFDRQMNKSSNINQSRIDLGCHTDFTNLLNELEV